MLASQPATASIHRSQVPDIHSGHDLPAVLCHTMLCFQKSTSKSFYALQVVFIEHLRCSHYRVVTTFVLPKMLHNARVVWSTVGLVQTNQQSLCQYGHLTLLLLGLRREQAATLVSCVSSVIVLLTLRKICVNAKTSLR